MTLKKQFERALREAEGGVELPEDQVERRLSQRLTRLEGYLAYTALGSLTAVLIAVLALLRP